MPYANDGRAVFLTPGHLPPLYNHELWNYIEAEKLKILGVINSVFLELPATVISKTPIHDLIANIQNN